MKASCHKNTRGVGLALLAGLCAAACMPAKTNTGTGGAAATGGSTSSSTRTGGNTSAGGTTSSGGITSAGGTTSAGGITSAGGTTNAGGTTHAGGGNTSAGGITSSSVASSSGGAPSGGSTAAGGSVSGGASGTGGSVASGGSSSSGGATAQTGGNTSAGGASSAGGTIAVTCPAVTSYAACTTDAGVVMGNACKPNPPMFALDANCNIGLWASDYTSSGYFYPPWCNNSTTPCAMTMACATGSMHIAGSYWGASTATMDGNAGWGGHLQTTYPDAGAGCQMIDGTGQTGLTLDINVTTLPTGNHLDIGISLANGNSADYSAVLTAGAQTVKIPWACFKNKLLCGSVPGPGIASFFFSFDWFNDGATHAVDITLSNIGFY